MIEVLDYDPRWPLVFDELAARIRPVLAGILFSIEHVGSTSVPGLAAKPIIDIDVIVAATDVGVAIERLATIGYEHQGDLGVPQREAFRHAGRVRHNLYVCVEGSTHLRNHLALRDHLRVDPEAARAYSALKKELAARFPDDIEAYVAGKCPLILRILEAAGFSEAELASIRGVNQPSRESAR
jgi:GrpB-like predicted nucleotidyltransferase (UPF0157 family)